MTVTLHIPHTRRAAVTRRLVELAGGDSKAVGSATHGLIVSDALALAYLSNGHNANGHSHPRPVPVGLAADIRAAETQAGMISEDTRAPATGSGARASTRSRKTTAASSKEQP